MFQKIKKYLMITDYWMFSFALILSILGIFAIYSAGYDPSTGNVEDYYSRQILWLFVGVVMFFITSFINYKSIVRYTFFIYGAGILVLAIVLVSGYIGMGAQRWLSIGPLRLQPSELFKIVWIITLAWLFMDFDENKFNILRILKKSIFLIPPFFLVFLQPDLGTSMTYLIIWGWIILILGVKRSVFIIAIVSMLIVLPILWSHMHDYQKKRVVTFINPEHDPFGAGYHIIQSKIGVGSGGIDGKGYLKGTQSHLRFIPERHTDFIYSVINEEFGLIGGSIILILFIILVIRIFMTSLNTKEPASKILCVAVGGYIFFQFIINSYMIVGMMPVVGIPMPFVSYGGSSLISFFIMLGLVNSVYIRRFTPTED